MAKNMLPLHENHLSRHAHNVGSGYTTTLVPGQLRCVYFDVLSPSESIYYKTKAFSRLQEVVTAFLGEIDIHLDYFFVPLQMLYTPFGQVFAQTNDVISENFSTLGQLGDENSDYFPTVSVVDAVHQRTNQFMENGESWGMSLMRLLDDFDLNPYNVLDLTQFQKATGDVPSEHVPQCFCYNPNITPWIPAAYQAIYQKYYRNESFERLRVPSYNFDSAYGDGQINASGRGMFNMRYCQRPSDYFTDVKVSPLYSAVNAFAKGSANLTDSSNAGGTYRGTEVLGKVNQWLVGGNTYSDGFYLGKNNENFDVSEYYTDYVQVANDNLSFAGSVVDKFNSFNNASAIRTLFAVDKFLRVYGRAGKTYDDQILAHFGFKVPHDVKHDLTHLKHYRFVLTSEPVYSSSATPDGSLLGQVGGQGAAKIETDGEKFTAPVHGVFMCIAHAVTKPRYYNTFNKLHLLNNRLAFPIPEYDKLGLQPQYMFEAHPIFFALNSEIHTADVNMSKRLGWQYRYEEFKKKYNRISLAYIPSLPNQQAPDTEISMQDAGANAFNPWVLSREASNYITNGIIGQDDSGIGFDDYNNLTASLYFERPDALNNIMVVSYDGTWKNDYFKSPWLAFQQDPLIFDYKCDVKKVSWMSETGEPDL